MVLIILQENTPDSIAEDVMQTQRVFGVAKTAFFCVMRKPLYVGGLLMTYAKAAHCHLGYYNQTVVHSLSAFIVWRRVVDSHSDLTTLIIMPSRIHIFRCDYGRRLPVGVFPRNWRNGSWRAGDRCMVVTTNPLCFRKLCVISSVPVIVSKCRPVGLHLFKWK